MLSKWLSHSKPLVCDSTSGLRSTPIIFVQSSGIKIDGVLSCSSATPNNVDCLGALIQSAPISIIITRGSSKSRNDREHI
jgi:hypothetical protein